MRLADRVGHGYIFSKCVRAIGTTDARVEGGTVAAGQRHKLSGPLRKDATYGADHRSCAIRQFPCPE